MFGLNIFPQTGHGTSSNILALFLHDGEQNSGILVDGYILRVKGLLQ